MAGRVFFCPNNIALPHAIALSGEPHRTAGGRWTLPTLVAMGKYFPLRGATRKLASAPTPVCTKHPRRRTRPPTKSCSWVKLKSNHQNMGRRASWSVFASLPGYKPCWASPPFSRPSGREVRIRVQTFSAVYFRVPNPPNQKTETSVIKSWHQLLQDLVESFPPFCPPPPSGDSTGDSGDSSLLVGAWYWVSCACRGVATTPVPMAQTGS